jgi:hypothetical protein
LVGQISENYQIVDILFISGKKNLQNLLLSKKKVEPVGRVELPPAD